METATRSFSDSEGKLNLAKIRHGLRTPINHIIGYAEILREEADGQLPPGFAADLEKIHSSGYILLALINRHLGEDCIHFAEPDLHSLCHELRTPVNHIIGYGELLAEECDELGLSELKPDLDKIIAAAHTWLELMEQHLGGPLRQMANAVPGTPVPRLDSDEIIAALQEYQIASTPLSEPREPCRGHLLLAEDDEANRDLLRRRLEKLGYRITACGDGGAALQLARETTPDLLLLDMVMPVLDGREVLIRIKSDDSLRYLPIIMISALDQAEGIAHCIEMGAEDYLSKPFSPIVLKARIGAALEKKRLRDFEQIYLRRIEEERARSDRLLLNILPQPIAERLKTGESRIVNSYDEVTVLFGDLVGFTSLSTRISPTLLVRMLDQIFSAMDELAERHGLEKIKTIGDAYMAAAGLPFPCVDHAQAAAHMASEMHKAVEQFSRQSGYDLQMRIGICSGPAIAGIIGRNKFIYDLWGDTVNTASRMESHGVAGRTQIAAATHERLRGQFRCEDRGTIEIRGKGPMQTFLLCPD